MDFQRYEIKTVIQEDQVMLWNKEDQLYYVMSIDSSKFSAEDLQFQPLEAQLTKYDFEFEGRDNVKLMPLDLSHENKNSKLIAINHTTTNDLYLQYNMGFGHLVINDYRVKDYRIFRAGGTRSPP